MMRRVSRPGVMSFLFFLALGFLSASESGAQGSILPRLLNPAELVYLGAFAAPESVTPPDYSEWAYGGNALSFDPGGDPDGADDGFPGSLYLSGNPQQDLVGEIGASGLGERSSRLIRILGKARRRDQRPGIRPHQPGGCSPQFS